MGKSQVNFDGLKQLAASAVMQGKESTFVQIALEWAEGAEARLRDVHRELDEAREVIQDLARTVQERDLTTVHDLRKKGLTIAVHNDYRLNGVAYTFYLFVGPDGMSYKGEGLTDAVALEQVLTAFETQQYSGSQTNPTPVP